MLNRLKARLREFSALQTLRARFVYRLTTREPAPIVLSRPGRYAAAPIETNFRGRSGVSLPVLTHFRYSMVPPLSYLPPFLLLEDLAREGLLTDSETKTYKRALGTRALSLPYEEVLALVAGLLPRLGDRLVPEGRDDPERAQLMPSPQALASRMASESFILRVRLIRIRQFAAPIEPGSRVLEIGYTTGGYSINAWDRLGFRVVGIDNAYDGAAAPPTIYHHIAERLGTKPTFVFGDVTRRTELPAGSFDVIYSVSVLEHVSDIAAAFKEFHRLLRPGGLMVHCWNPYFSPNGGHPWGLLDAPWGHLRLPQSDLDQYIDELRPLEAPLARPWLWRTLDRDTTLARMQTKVAQAGFRLLLWDQVPEHPDILGDLTPGIFAECQSAYPQVTLADLTTRDAMMVARKQ